MYRYTITSTPNMFVCVPTVETTDAIHYITLHIVFHTHVLITIQLISLHILQRVQHNCRRLEINKRLRTCMGSSPAVNPCFCFNSVITFPVVNSSLELIVTQHVYTCLYSCMFIHDYGFMCYHISLSQGIAPAVNIVSTILLFRSAPQMLSALAN